MRIYIYAKRTFHDLLQNHFSKMKIVYKILELLPIVYLLRFLSDDLATVILKNHLSIRKVMLKQERLSMLK